MANSTENKTVRLCVVLTLCFYIFKIFAFATPLPMAYLMIRRGIRKTLPALFVSWGLFAVYIYLSLSFHFFSSEPNSAAYLPLSFFLSQFPQPAVLGAIVDVLNFSLLMLISYGIAKALEVPEKVFENATRFVIGLFALVCVLSLPYVLANREQMYAEIWNYVSKGFEALIASQENTGSADINELYEMRSQADVFVRYFIMLMPAFIFCFVSGLFVANLALAKSFFTPFVRDLGRVHLLNYEISFAMIWTLIVTLAAHLFNNTFLNNTGLQYLTSNLLVIYSVFYFFQGLAVFMTLLDRYRITGILKFMLFALIFVLFQLVFIALVILGLVESWADIRHLTKKAPKPPLKTA